MLTSPAEQMLVHRLRKDWTQQEAADHWGVVFSRYRAWESGHIPIPVRVPLGSAPTLREKLILLRRRANMTQAELGERMGIHRQQICEMERGHIPYDRLGEYWAKQL